MATQTATGRHPAAASKARPAWGRAAGADDVVDQEGAAPFEAGQEVWVQPHAAAGLRSGDGGGGDGQGFGIPELAGCSGGDPVGVAEAAGDALAEDVAEGGEADHDFWLVGGGQGGHPDGELVGDGEGGPGWR